MSCELVLEKGVVSVDQQQDSNVLGAQCEERTWRESIMGVAAKSTILNQQSRLYSVVGENKKAAGIDPAAFGAQGRLELIQGRNSVQEAQPETSQQAKMVCSVIMLFECTGISAMGQPTLQPWRSELTSCSSCDILDKYGFYALFPDVSVRRTLLLLL